MHQIQVSLHSYMLVFLTRDGPWAGGGEMGNLTLLFPSTGDMIEHYIKEGLIVPHEVLLFPFPFASLALSVLSVRF